MADDGQWHCLNEETLPPLERLLPDEVYQALLEEVKRQRDAMPPASGLGINHLNTIPANYADALKKATILMDRTLRWRRLCFVYEMGEREARKRYQAIAKRNEELERRHQEDQQTIRRLRFRLKSLLKIPEPAPEDEADPETASPEPVPASPRKRGACRASRKLAVYSTEVLGIPLTASGVLGILNRMADRMEPIYDGLAHALTVQRTLHGDETEWKMDGQRWQMWCFCNASMAFFHADKSRGSKVPIALLGKDFPGLLHCDFYAAYNPFANLQRCLVHFARDVHDERLITPDDAFLDVLHDKTQFIMDSAKALAETENLPPDIPALQSAMHHALDDMIALAPPPSRALTLVKRLQKHHDSLLNFLTVPGAEFHNNRAERQLRPVVIFRKLSFGNRTETGAYRFSVMATVIETARLQNQNIQDFLLRIRLGEACDFAPLAAELLNSS